MKANIKIEFFDYWHCGSGISGGAETDALINRDPNHLPYVPGKTLKGHIREAAEWLKENNASDDFDKLLKEIFGNENEKKDNQFASDANEGHQAQVYFSDSYLSNSIAEVIHAEKGERFLVNKIFSTSIDEHGVAKSQSLRSAEVAIPLTLYGFIGVKEPKQKEFLKLCMGMVKELGAGKTRGLGRCRISFIDN